MSGSPHGIVSRLHSVLSENPGSGVFGINGFCQRRSFSGRRRTLRGTFRAQAVFYEQATRLAMVAADFTPKEKKAAAARIAQAGSSNGASA